MSVWKVHSEEPAYTNRWLAVHLADVELPDGRHLDHYLLRQRPVAVCAIVRDNAVLMLWRHRFITDAWGYELPAGVIDPDESPVDAAAREAEEETGWRPTNLAHLLDLHPLGGLSDTIHHVYWTNTAQHIGDPEDDFESTRREWIPLTDIPDLIDNGQIHEANAATATMRLSLMRG